MHCRNIFCIYQKEDACLIAEEARLDDWGRCENYLSIWLEADVLAKEKKRMLVDYVTEDFANAAYPPQLDLE